MRSILAIAAIVASVAAQSTQNLTAALTSTPSLSNLTTLLQAYPDVVSSLSSATNITILAPSNDAISKLLNSSAGNATLGDQSLVKAILSYHILNGTYNSSNITTTPTFIATHLTNTTYANVTGGQRVEALNNSGTVQILSGLLTTSNVTQADIGFTGGIIHVIDTILVPPANISDTAEEFNYTAVAGALTSADLVDTIDSASELTVFVPNNEAFQAIASVVANASMETIASVLAYHVVNGSVLYSPMIMNQSVTSFGGTNLTLTVANGSIFVNQAKVVVPNVLVANGVVHVIDSVLNPNDTSVAPGTNATAYANASSASDVPFTSGVPSPTGSATVPAVVASTSASSSGNWAPHMAMPTGLIAGGALFAGALMAL